MVIKFEDLRRKMSSEAQLEAQKLTNKLVEEVKTEKVFDLLIEFRGSEERLSDAFKDIVKELIKYDFIDSVEIGPLNVP